MKLKYYNLKYTLLYDVYSHNHNFYKCCICIKVPYMNHFLLLLSVRCEECQSFAHLIFCYYL